MTPSSYQMLVLQLMSNNRNKKANAVAHGTILRIKLKLDTQYGRDDKNSIY